MAVCESKVVFGEFPMEWPFTRTQEDFMGGLVEKSFRGVDFGQLEDEEGHDFQVASSGLSIDFRAARERLMGRFWKGRQRGRVEEIRRLSLEDLAHYCHNQIMDWERQARRCKEGSDKFIEANDEAYEWLKVGRLAEDGARFLGLPSMDFATWPI